MVQDARRIARGWPYSTDEVLSLLEAVHGDVERCKELLNTRVHPGTLVSLLRYGI
jgi:hypothetical protein